MDIFFLSVTRLISLKKSKVEASNSLIIPFLVCAYRCLIGQSFGQQKEASKYTPVGTTP